MAVADSIEDFVAVIDAGRHGRSAPGHRTMLHRGLQQPVRRTTEVVNAIHDPVVFRVEVLAPVKHGGKGNHRRNDVGQDSGALQYAWRAA